MLASCLIETGKYEEAEMLSKSILAIFKRQGIVEQAGSDLPLLNLAQIYEKQGRYKEAETYYRRLLDIQERIYGPERLFLVGVLSRLARVCWHLLNHKEARQLYERALAIYTAQPEQWQRFPSMVSHVQAVQQEYEQLLRDS